MSVAPRGQIDPRLARAVERLQRLGQRPTAELLAQLGRDYGIDDDELLARVEVFANTPSDILRAFGGHRFAPMVFSATGGCS